MSDIIANDDASAAFLRVARAADAAAASTATATRHAGELADLMGWLGEQMRQFKDAPVELTVYLNGKKFPPDPDAPKNARRK